MITLPLGLNVYLNIKLLPKYYFPPCIVNNVMRILGLRLVFWQVELVSVHSSAWLELFQCTDVCLASIV